MMQRNSWLLLVLPLLTAAAGCEGGGATDSTGGGAVARITVTPDSTTLTQGQSLQLTALPYASDGSIVAGRAITWSSSDPQAVSVSSTGVARGVGPGRALIRASAGSMRAEAVARVDFQGTYSLWSVNGLPLSARIAENHPCTIGGSGPVTVHYGKMVFRGDSVDVELHVQQTCSPSTGSGMTGWSKGWYTFDGRTIVFRAGTAAVQLGTGTFSGNTIILSTNYRGLPITAEYRK